MAYEKYEETEDIIDWDAVAKQPLYYRNAIAKGKRKPPTKKRIKAGSGEKMRKPGTKGAPTKAQFKRAAKTAKKRTRKRR